MIPSAFVGALSGYFLRGRILYFVPGALPWFGLLDVLLYDIYEVIPEMPKWHRCGHSPRYWVEL